MAHGAVGALPVRVESQKVVCLFWWSNPAHGPVGTLLVRFRLCCSYSMVDSVNAKSSGSEHSVTTGATYQGYSNEQSELAAVSMQ